MLHFTAAVCVQNPRMVFFELIIQYLLYLEMNDEVFCVCAEG